MRTLNKTFKGNNAPKPTVFVYEIVSFFRDAFFEFISLFMLLYVQIASPITGTAQYTTMYMVITLVLILSRVIAAFSWVFFSHILATWHFPFGRYRTMIFSGAVIVTTMFILMFFVSPLFSGWGYVASFLVFYTLTISVYAINDIGYWSFINTLTNDEQKRGHIASFMSLAVALGSYTVASISPAVTGSNAKANMTLLALVLISCYFFSQMILVFVMREKEEQPEISIENDKATLLEPFGILFKDKQVLIACLAFALIFLSQDLLIGNASNYFYYEYGYGSFGVQGHDNTIFSGGVVSFVFSICFGCGIASSQALYSLIVRKLTKKKTLWFSLMLVSFSYLFLFFYAFHRGHEIALFITSFLLAFGHGLSYMVMSMNVFDCSEEYQFKTGKDRNPAIQSLKSFSVLIAIGIQTGFFYLFLASSGLMKVTEKMGELENQYHAGQIENLTASVNQMVNGTEGIQQSLNIFLSGLTLLPLLCTLLAIILTLTGVKVNDEKEYANMVAIIEERNKTRLENIEEKH